MSPICEHDSVPIFLLGCGADCSSYTELVLSERMGLTGEEIMFTSTLSKTN